MEINGLKIRDITDIQDALTAFSTLNAELENLSDSMAQNLGDYKSLTSNQKEILEAINTLQINSNKIKDELLDFANVMPNFVNKLNDKISLNSTNVIKQIEKSLSDANGTINRNFESLKKKIDGLEDSNLEAIKKAIDSVNFSRIEKAINSQIAKQQKELSSHISTLDGSIDSINKSSKNLEAVQHNINLAISNFNKASKSLTVWKIVAVLFVGAFVGAGAMLAYGLPVAKPLYYTDLVKARKDNLATQEDYKAMIQKANGVVKWLDKNNIRYGYGYFSDTKLPYFFFEKSNYKTSWTDKQGDFVINLKK